MPPRLPRTSKHNDMPGVIMTTQPYRQNDRTAVSTENIGRVLAVERDFVKEAMKGAEGSPADDQNIRPAKEPTIRGHKISPKVMRDWREGRLAAGSTP